MNLKRSTLKSISSLDLTGLQARIVLGLVAATATDDTSIQGLCDMYKMKRDGVAKAIAPLKKSGLVYASTQLVNGRKPLRLDEEKLEAMAKGMEEPEQIAGQRKITDEDFSDIFIVEDVIEGTRHES